VVGESVNWKYAGRRATCFGRDVHRNIALSTAPTYSALEVNIWTPEAQLGRGKSFLRNLDARREQKMEKIGVPVPQSLPIC
jgi:hypothetical protein